MQLRTLDQSTQLLRKRPKSNETNPDRAGRLDRTNPLVRVSIAKAIQWYRDAHLPRLSRSEQRNRSRHLDRIVTALAPIVTVADVTRTDVSDAAEKWRTEHGPYEVNRTLATLSRVWNLFYLQGWTGLESITKGVPRHKERRSEARLTPEQCEDVVGSLRTEAEDGCSVPSVPTAIHTLLLTGARMSEVCSALRSQYDGRAIVWREHKTDGHIGTKRIPLSSAARDLLGDWLAHPWLKRRYQTDDARYLFPGRTHGSHVQSVGKCWRRVLERAGVPYVRIHDLRHTLATIGIESGVPLEQMRDILGHKDIRTTQLYVHPSHDVLVSSLDSFSAKLVGGK